MNGVGLAGQALVFLSRIGWRSLYRLWLVLGITVGVLCAEWFVLSRLHTLFPQVLESSFAPFLAASIANGFIFLRVVLIGAGVASLGVLAGCLGGPPNRRYWRSWTAIAAAFSLALFALDATQIQLQFRGVEPLDPATGIALSLGTYYGQIFLLGFAACLFAACPQHLNVEPGSRIGLWGFSRNNRVAIFVGGFIVYLLIDKVLLPTLLYLPFVAPFWTMTSELSELRHYAVRIVTIIAQSLSVLIYAAFVLSAFEWCRNPGRDQDSASPAP